MRYAICTVPAAPLRKEPSHRSEMVSQLLFGETMQIVGLQDEWFQIKSTYDGYEGWLTHHLIAEVIEQMTQMEMPFVAALLVNPVNRNAQLIHVPMGASLPCFNEETKALWEEPYSYQGSYRDTRSPFDYSLLQRTAEAWLNAPYLWGGKTFMGVDCSGFVQILFKLLGIRLKRDAYQQAEEGVPVSSTGDTKGGDLAFFHNEKGKVTHVGLVLEGQQIIHAAGRVRIDRFDSQGIINSETGKTTHELHSIRRYF